jgi:hypothetical protein
MGKGDKTKGDDLDWVWGHYAHPQKEDFIMRSFLMCTGLLAIILFIIFFDRIFLTILEVFGYKHM